MDKKLQGLNLGKNQRLSFCKKTSKTTVSWKMHRLQVEFQGGKRASSQTGDVVNRLRTTPAFMLFFQQVADFSQQFLLR